MCFDSAEVVLHPNYVQKLKLIISPDDFTYNSSDLKWTSSNSEVISINDNGTVTAKQIGSATVTVQWNDNSDLIDSCTIYVVDDNDAAIAALQARVDEAQKLYDGSTEGLAIGNYAAGSRGELLAAINDVKAKISAKMSKTDIDACNATLDAALAAFAAAQVGTGSDTDLSTLENVIYIDKVEAVKGHQYTLSVKLKNNVDIQGYQFDLYLPQGISVATDENGKALATLSRARMTDDQNNSFGFNFQTDGALRVLDYFTDRTAFSGTDGEVAQIILNVTDSLKAGDYPVVLKKVTVTSTAEKGYDTKELKSTITVKDYKLGDVNNDGIFNVLDVTATNNYILGLNPESFIKDAADVNKDGEVNVTDLIIMNNRIADGKSIEEQASAKSMIVRELIPE